MITVQTEEDVQLHIPAASIDMHACAAATASPVQCPNPTASTPDRPARRSAATVEEDEVDADLKPIVDPDARVRDPGDLRRHGPGARRSSDSAPPSSQVIRQRPDRELGPAAGAAASMAAQERAAPGPGVPPTEGGERK